MAGTAARPVARYATWVTRPLRPGTRPSRRVSTGIAARCPTGLCSRPCRTRLASPSRTGPIPWTACPACSRRATANLPMAPARIARQVEPGEIDLAFHTSEKAPPHLRRHPAFAQFCKLEFALVSTVGGAFHGVTEAGQAGRTPPGRAVGARFPVPACGAGRHRPGGDAAVAAGPRQRRAASGRGAHGSAGFLSMLRHEHSHRDPTHQCFVTSAPPA